MLGLGALVVALCGAGFAVGYSVGSANEEPDPQEAPDRNSDLLEFDEPDFEDPNQEDADLAFAPSARGPSLASVLGLLPESAGFAQEASQDPADLILVDDGPGPQASGPAIIEGFAPGLEQLELLLSSTEAEGEAPFTLIEVDGDTEVHVGGQVVARLPQTLGVTPDDIIISTAET